MRFLFFLSLTPLQHVEQVSLVILSLRQMTVALYF